MRQSTRPCVFQTESNKALTALGSLISAAYADAFSFRPVRFDTRASSLSWLRPTRTTCAPSRANSHAVARPIPPAPPDNTTTMSLRISDANAVRCTASSSSVSPSLSGRSGVLLSAMGGHVLEQLACDDHLSDFCRSGADLQQLDRTKQPVDLRLPDVAAAAMDLHGLVEDCVASLCSVHHRGRRQHMNIAASATADFERRGSRQRAIGEGPHGFDLNVHLRQHRLNHLEGSDGLAELLPGLCVVDGELQRPF